MLWTALPEAAALLADCAKSPPARDHRTGTFNRPARLFRIDERVKRLNAIHRHESERLFAEAEASGNRDAFNSHEVYSVQTAIFDAIFFARLAARLADSAACDARVAA